MPKVVILAGGLGTRISEESHLKPKPMIEIGGMPILWHIMKNYSHFGYNEFIICTGYKGYVIKEFFKNYYLHSSDVTFDFHDNNKIILHNTTAEPWKVTVVDTGLNTMTGGRLKRIKDFIGDDDYLLATYGDGVSDVNINEVVDFHLSHDKLATITTAMPTGRFGVVKLEEDGTVKEFIEKPKTENSWINIGFFVFDKKVFDYIEGDNTILENEPFNVLTSENQMKAFKHNGFWKPMDTLRDNIALNDLWDSGEPKWKLWS